MSPKNLTYTNKKLKAKGKSLNCEQQTTKKARASLEQMSTLALRQELKLVVRWGERQEDWFGQPHGYWGPLKGVQVSSGVLAPKLLAILKANPLLKRATWI